MQATTPHGRLTICAPTSFGISQLSNIIPQYLERYPQVQISISLTDRFIDVISEGFDLVLRIAELEDSSLIARKIAPCKRAFCASANYIKRYGIVKVAQDLSIHHCLTYANDLKPDTWALHGTEHIDTIKVNGPVCTDNDDILKA